MQVRNIPVAEIVPSDLNPRKTFDQVELQELADSIRENGLVQPITIRKTDREDGKYEIVCGERRYRAFLLLGENTIPSVVKKIDDKRAFAIMVIENLQRKDIDPMEEAWALKKLYDEKTMTVAEMAKVLGKSTSFVMGRIKLSNIIPEFVQMMRDGTLYLVHLLEICLLPTEEQKILYNSCFTPECVERWNFKILKLELMREWINTHVMNHLDNVNFDLADESFENSPSCETCPFNTKNNAETFKDCNRPRCMKRDCFVAKVREGVLREAMTCGLPLVYAGSQEDNAEIIAHAESKGLTLTPVGKRTYVIEPIAPNREDYNDEETFEKRNANYQKVREAFDSNLNDGTVERVFEVSFSGKTSGEIKYLYTAPEIDTNNEDAVRAVESSKVRITEYKKRLAATKRDKELEVVERKRQFMETAEYSSLNTKVEKDELAVFLAIIMKRLGYAYKEKIGFRLEESLDYRQAKELILHNKNSIIREFISSTLSEKSVCFSQDLANMLTDIMASRFPSPAQEIESSAEDKYDAIRASLQSKIDELKEQPLPAE